MTAPAAQNNEDIFVKVQVDCETFRDGGLLGPCPVVEFLQELGLTITEETSELDNSVVYRVDNTSALWVRLTREVIEKCILHFSEVCILQNAEGLILLMQLDLVEYLEILE